MTTTRRARKRPAESLCHPPSAPGRANEATTFAPRPRVLKRPELPPSRPPPHRSPEPIRRGSPPALRTATWTCFKNGRLRGLIRVPPLRDRPGLTRKFSLSSRAMTRRLTSECADTRAAQHRSHQIASDRSSAHESEQITWLLLDAHCGPPSFKKLKSKEKICSWPVVHLARCHRDGFARCKNQCADKLLGPEGASERQFALSCRHSLAVTPSRLVTVRALHVFRIFCSRCTSSSLFF